MLLKISIRTNNLVSFIYLIVLYSFTLFQIIYCTDFKNDFMRCLKMEKDTFKIDQKLTWEPNRPVLILQVFSRSRERYTDRFLREA